MCVDDTTTTTGFLAITVAGFDDTMSKMKTSEQEIIYESDFEISNATNGNK